MGVLSTAKRRELLRRVYPELRFGGDPDIERYFELRKDGRLSDALSVYNGPIRSRYPADSSRLSLLQFFREGDPRYSAFLDSLLLSHAVALAERISLNIDLIVAPVESAELGDALRALKAVEGVLARFRGDSETALNVLARYDEYARVLGYRTELTRRAFELVKEYDAVARADSPADYDFVARSEALEARRRAAAGHTQEGGTWREERYDFVRRSAELELRRRQEEERRKTHYFDPGRIKFSKADRARVEIPAIVARREDKILAFCAKYWNRVQDPAFDHLVFLYSRKFGTKHYEVFRTIKTGRSRGLSDDEILSSVSGVLSTNYNYSVSGDLYMQVMWRRLRARMEAQILEAKLAIPGPESKVRAAHEERKREVAKSPRRLSAAELRAAEGRTKKPHRASRIDRLVPRIDSSDESRSRVAASSETGLPSGGKFGFPIPGQTRTSTIGMSATSGGTTTSTAKTISRTSLSEPGTNRVRGSRIEPVQRTGRADSPGTSSAEIVLRRSPVRGAALLAKAPPAREAVPRIVGRGGSISDRVRQLSGKAYDVYRNIFLERVREHIRRALLANRTKNHGIFDTATNEAEDQVFGFISGHYDDPFLNWDGSAERLAVEALGFSLPSLDPIIVACYRKL